jgi:N-methylhydantoinase A
VLSGPAGGVAGSVHAARLSGHKNLIPFDMGGTSSDICLVVDGAATLVMDRKIGGHRLALNSLDIASIGAGGGSIAHVDAGGILHVGPESAGAMPGPACYGQGGAAATVTDANLVLGYLDPERFLGGERWLDGYAAARAVDRVAQQLGIERMAAAHGIHRIVNTNMAEGVRLVSVRRGVDPRRFALFAFGGAAGLHATDIARQLGLKRVIVPRVAAVLSAWGMLATDLRFEISRSHVGDTSALDGAAVKDLFEEMETEGLARLRASFTGPARTARSVDMRYGEQIFEINVPLEDLDLSSAGVMLEVVERFHRRHEELYTYSMRDQDVLLVNARVAVRGVLPELPREPELPVSRPAQASSRRRIYLNRWQQVPVFDLEQLAAGQVIDGPAIIEAPTTTVLLHGKESATITPLGWIDIRLS